MKYLGTMIVRSRSPRPLRRRPVPRPTCSPPAQGARLVQVPDDAEFTAMDSSPLNLI